MKNTAKRICTSILVMSFLFSAGCKKKKKAETKLVQETDPYYSCEEIKLDFQIPGDEDRKLKARYFDDQKIFSDGIVMTVTEEYVIPEELEERYTHFQYNPEDENNVAEYTKLLEERSSYSRKGLVVFGLDGKMKKFTPFDAASQVLGIAEDPSGKVKILLNTSDLNLNKNNSTILCDLSPEGELVNPVSLGKTVRNGQDLLLLDNGNFFCFDNEDRALLLFKADGTLLNEESFLGMSVSRLFQVNGKYYAYIILEHMDDSAPDQFMYEFDPATGKKVGGKKGEKLDVTCPVHGSLFVQGKDGVYATLGNGIRKYDLLNGTEPQQILSWSNTDCNYFGIESASTYIESENDIYVLRKASQGVAESYGWFVLDNPDSLNIMHLHREEKNPHAGKKIISLASIGNLDEYFLDQLNNYNLDPGKTARIVVKDYSTDNMYSRSGSAGATFGNSMDFQTTEDFSKIADQVYLDVRAGDGPDILLNFGSFSQFNTERALVDLNALLDGESPLDRSLLYDNILRSYETNGKLYQIPLTFNVTGMLVNTNYVGDRTGWTYEEFNNISQSLPEDVKMIGIMTQSDLLEMLLDGSTSHFLDYDGQKVKFDDPEFREILTLVKSYGIPKTYSEIYEESLSDEAKFQEGMLASMNWSFSIGNYNFGRFLNIYDSFDGKVSMLGYPGMDGSGARADKATSIAISQASQYKNEAWDFIRSLYEEDTQIALSRGTLGFPLNRKALDHMLDLETKSNQRAWERAETDESVMLSMTYDNVHMNEEHVTLILNIIENIHGSCSSDPSALLIIQEEAPGYFTGQRTLDDVVNIIQKRAATVVQERG